MTNPIPLTENELRAVAYFGVGVTSEGSVAGRDVAYRLSFAGNVRAGGRMDPVGNSGYSFGTLQIDLGQHPAVARDLLESYQDWATTQVDRAAVELSSRNFDQTLTGLQRTGRQMRAVGAIDIDRSTINRFMASDAGRQFVHGLDVAHANGVTAVDQVIGNSDSALERLQRTDLYRNASGDEQARLAGMFMKLQNQAGNGYWPGIMRRVETGTLVNSEKVKEAVNALLRNNSDGSADYIQSGADNTLRGITVFNSLRNAQADNPLSTAWNNVLADPLIGPVAAQQADPGNPNRGFEYDMVRSMFLTPEQSVRFIRALDEGEGLSEGEPQLRNGRRQAGFYVAGNDFVHWNRNGEGLAYIGGQWSEVDPDNLQCIRHPDGSVELFLQDRTGERSTLLRVDARAPRQRAEILEVDRFDGVVSVTHAEHPDNSLLQKMRGCVQVLDEATGKSWDDASERLCASAFLMAKKQGFTERDDLKLTFNQPTERYASGELIHLLRRGPTASHDPARNRTHMTTVDALSKSAHERYGEVEALDLAQVQVMQVAHQQTLATDELVRSNAEQMARM